MKTKEELIKEIELLELEVGKLEHTANNKILGHKLFPQYLKLVRKLQKLRNKL